METGADLFLVVRFDRHIDDEISVHATREGADAAVAEFIARYGDYAYEWTEREVKGWLRSVDTVTDSNDDGPHVRIEAGRLRP